MQAVYSIPYRSSSGLRRAAHQLYDAKPLVLDDPIATAILGERYAEELRRTPTRPDRPFSVALRAFIVARSRYAEDMLRDAVGQGVTQYVLLGAGLDTFAHRNPYSDLRVFEVDHPATQSWKRDLLTESTLPSPKNLVYAPVDFETQDLPTQLRAAGFDPEASTFFAWLGVVPYLTHGAFRTTLDFIASRPRGSGLVLDYANLDRHFHSENNSLMTLCASRFNRRGNPSSYSSRLLRSRPNSHAFYNLEDLGSPEINTRYLDGRADDLLKALGSAGRLLSAWL